MARVDKRVWGGARDLALHCAAVNTRQHTLNHNRSQQIKQELDNEQKRIAIEKRIRKSKFTDTGRFGTHLRDV